MESGVLRQATGYMLQAAGYMPHATGVQATCYRLVDYRLLTISHRLQTTDWEVQPSRLQDRLRAIYTMRLKAKTDHRR